MKNYEELLKEQERQQKIAAEANRREEKYFESFLQACEKETGSREVFETSGYCAECLSYPMVSKPYSGGKRLFYCDCTKGKF